MIRSFVKRTFRASLILAGFLVSLIAITLFSAAVSLWRAERKAHDACETAKPGTALSEYLADLKSKKFDQRMDRFKDAAQFQTVSTRFNTLTMSRFVCRAEVKDDVIQFSEVVYVD